MAAPSSSPDCSVAILGSGALACFLGAALAESGSPVRLLSDRRPPGPIHVSVAGGARPLDFTFQVESPFSRAWDPEDTLLLASKAPACRAFLERLATAGSTVPETWIACNGLGLLENLPRGRFARGLARLLCGFGVRESAPGRYQFSGGGVAGHATVVPGSFAPRLLRALASMNISISPPSDLRDSEWKKIAWNASMNGILALEGLRNGELLSRPPLLVRFDALLAETVSIARTEGVELDPHGTLRAEILDSVRKTAGNLNSMAMDLARKQPTEIDWINGAVVRTALRHGIAAPENQRLLAEVLTREKSWA